MKNTLLRSALFTLIVTQVYAEQTLPVTTPLQTTAMQPVAPQNPQPNQSIPNAPVSTSSSEPVIDCDYKIPAQTKKIEQTVILTWSKNATMQAFNFDPASLDLQMQKLQACFTEQGWTGFNTALQKSGNMQTIKSQKLTVTSQIVGEILINEAKDNQWKLTLPLMVTYQNEKEKVSQLLSVNLIVARKPNGDLGITQMIATPGGTVTTKKPVQAPLNPENTNLDARPNDPQKQPPINQSQ
ncbi:DotI/IcmL family type IV secretion protein [Legionella sp.]|uniref:DotI/IcmL family type IV secretion protein n=1 Tax=Legionella sp. TaxID=459 RepID=UPI003CB3737C